MSGAIRAVEPAPMVLEPVEPGRARSRGVTSWSGPRYVLRYGLVLWAVLATVGAELAVAAQRGMQWRGDLVWTIDWLPVAFIIVGPVVSGLAAVDTCRLAEGAEHTTRSRLARSPSTAVAATYAGLVGAAHLGVLAAMLIVSAPPVGDPFAFLAVGVQLAILAVFAILGTAIGRFAGPLVGGATAALTALAAVFVASSPTGHIVLLEVGGATIPRVGYRYDGSHLALQLLALVLCAVALVAPRPREGRRIRAVSRRDAALALAAVIALGAICAVPTSKRLSETDAMPDSCALTEGVETCFYAQHQRVAAEFREKLAPIITATREQGFGELLPARAAEASRTLLPQAADPSVAPLYVMPEHLQGVRPTTSEIISGMVSPVHCAQVQQDEPPSEQYWRDLDALTVTWVELVEPDYGASVGYVGARLDADDASEILEGFRTCTYPHF
ncbi:hypothetical protein [Cellulomonas gilvus]|uniref:Uncharacterized protein n=1 Tax=Cellulomonas gilvus (strain ATCC 13127 / NRRL B-14078) TaxID=593907 RepID=F8A6Q2_CELGA|nr:hypothetical protein [Cellulomonas gilvus]AEI11112.1 hypothetical protein Celgi_0592 [Cellulomonas gilvus ATCC 13127]